MELEGPLEEELYHDLNEKRPLNGHESFSWERTGGLGAGTPQVVEQEPWNAGKDH